MTPPGASGIETALAARRDAYDPRRQLVRRCAASWTVLGTGSAIAVAAFAVGAFAHAMTAAMLLMLVALTLAIGGFRAVEGARAALRRYDERVQPLPAARLRTQRRSPTA